MTLLLDLPAEIVQHVLYMLDPASFYLSLLTSKHMRLHALQSKRLLLHQLSQIPGARQLPRQVREDASLLLSKFGKQATKHLFNGASRVVDKHIWKVSDTMDRDLSKIVPWYNASACEICVATNQKVSMQNRRPFLILEIHPNIGTIKIRSMEGRRGRYDHPSLLYIISAEFLSGAIPASYNPENYRIVKVAWTGACPSETCDSLPSLAILLYPSETASLNLTLVFVLLDPTFGPRITEKYHVKPPLFGRQVATVNDLVISTEGNPMITWVSPQYCVYKFVAYKRKKDDLWNTRHLIEEINHDISPMATVPDRISHMRIEGENVLFFPKSLQMPFWKGVRDAAQKWVFLREDTNLPELHGIWPSEVFGIPIKSHHRHRISHTSLNNGAPTCINTGLKLVMNRKRYGGDHHRIPLRTGIFVLKSIHFPNGCKQFNPYASNGPLEHIFVASLTDPPPLDNLPTIGLKVAVSPLSHRVALAAWRTLKIYSLDPDAFLSSKYSYGSRKTHSRRHPYDYAFTTFCGWDFYRNGTRFGTCVLLEPVDIKINGVIYLLEWRTEAELWALTSEGVCKWDVGAWANGRTISADMGDGDCDVKFPRRVQKYKKV